MLLWSDISLVLSRRLSLLPHCRYPPGARRITIASHISKCLSMPSSTLYTSTHCLHVAHFSFPSSLPAFLQALLHPGHHCLHWEKSGHLSLGGSLRELQCGFVGLLPLSRRRSPIAPLPPPIVPAGVAPQRRHPPGRRAIVVIITAVPPPPLPPSLPSLLGPAGSR